MYPNIRIKYIGVFTRHQIMLINANANLILKEYSIYKHISVLFRKYTRISDLNTFETNNGSKQDVDSILNTFHGAFTYIRDCSL